MFRELLLKILMILDNTKDDENSDANFSNYARRIQL